MVNLPTLQRVVLAPEDVIDASLQIAVFNPPSTGSILVYRMIHPEAAAPVSGTDYDAQPLATLPMNQFLADPALAKGAKAAAIPGLADLIRHGLKETPGGLPLLLVVEGVSPQTKTNFAMGNTLLTATVTSYPKHNLFTPPVQPRDGVYAQARDGHLFYGDSRLRIWGCVRPQVPNIETADRIANMGFNAIRMWGPRANDLPNGTNLLIDDKSGEFVPATQGDGSPLDEYDHFYAEAKKDGLFIMATGLMDMPHISAKSEWLQGEGSDWADWQKAVATKPDGWILNFMAAVDDRLYKARQQQIKNYLTHVNPYTRKDYAHEEAIAIYELANENAHVKRTLEKGFEKWPPFFVSELQQRWNKWLTDRYHDDAGLTKAWTQLDPQESLSSNTIKLEPVVVHHAAYSNERASDFIRFLIELNSDLNKRLEDYARSFAPKGVGVAVIPFSYDTQYMPSNAWLYDDTKNADVANFGMYFWSLQNPLTQPPGMYVMDSNTVEGKITAIYETMDGRPDPYRAAYPYRLAALASWQDWDAIFFHYWDGFHEKGRTASDEDYLASTLSYISPSHYWTAVYYEKDPALLSPMAIAGHMFMTGAIAPAPHPLTYVLGEKSIFDLSALGGTSLARATYSQGARIRFAPDSPTGTTIEGTPQEALDTPPTGAIAMGDQVLWDWPNGRLIIDTPTAKAYVGIPQGKYRFKDGITVGGFDGKFVSFGMISMDGKPLTGPDATKSIYITAANNATNTGYHIKFDEATDPMPTGGPLGIGKLIDNNGTSPVRVDPVPYQIWFPTNLSGHFTGYDLARRQRLDKPVANGHVEHDGSELYLASLSIDSPGTQAIETPPTDLAKPPSATSKLETAAAPASVIDLPELTSMWNPLPGVKWTDAMDVIESHLHASGAHFDSATVKPDLLHISNLDALFHSPSETEVIYRNGHMTGINVTFTQPPVFTDVVADYDKQLGVAVDKKLAASEDQVSTVKWLVKKGALTVTVTATETQGTLGIAYTLSP